MTSPFNSRLKLNTLDFSRVMKAKQRIKTHQITKINSVILEDIA